MLRNGRSTNLDLRASIRYKGKGGFQPKKYPAISIKVFQYQYSESESETEYSSFKKQGKHSTKEKKDKW